MLGTLAGNFSDLCGVTHKLYTHNSVSVDHCCTAHHTVGSISGFFIKIRFYSSFGYNRLTRKIRFIYL